MFVELYKKDVIKENSGTVNEIYELDENGLSEIKTLEFEGFIGFNKDVASKLIKHGFTLFKYFKFVRSNDEVSYMFSVPCTKKSMFIFNYLKTLGITLTELNVEFEKKEDMFRMYVHNKIIRAMNLSNEDTKRDLTYYLYSLCKMFSLIAEADTQVTQPESLDANGWKQFLLQKGYLHNMYSKFNSMPEKVLVDIVLDNTDVDFKEVNYYTESVNKYENLKYNSSIPYVYNTFIGAGLSTSLLGIACKNFNDVYIIDKHSGVICTNNVLQKYNTLDFNEWIPYLVRLLVQSERFNFKHVKVLHRPVVFPNNINEYEMNIEACEYESFLNTMTVDISENTDISKYKHVLGNKVIKVNGNSVNLSEQYKDDAYAQQLYAQVQDYYDTFDLKDLTGTVKGIANGEVYSMIFTGESGTGKSTAARVIFHKCGIPYVAINCSTNIDEADLFGSMKGNDEKKSELDPEFVWNDGIITKAIRNGYGLIIEELNFARPGILGKLNSILDESRQIDLPNGEIVKAHKNFRVIATGNIGYEGTNRLNKALVNRFEICKHFEDLQRAESLDIINKRVGYTDMSKMNKIYDVYDAIKKYSKEQNLNLVVSIRQLLNIFKQGKFYKTAYDAVSNGLLNTAFLEERDHLEYFKESILPAFDLKFKI